MLFPNRPVIECCVRHGTIFNRVETSNPREFELIPAFEERTGCDCRDLLKSFGKVAFKILSEMDTLALFDGVSAEFKNLKVAHMLIVFKGCVKSCQAGLGQYEVAKGTDR